MTQELQDAVFMKACRGEPTPYTPIWLNRQAGRYMKEYHEVKGETPSLDFFKTPHLAAQVTCDAQRILGVDAAILFADLLPILEPLGFDLDYIAGFGPSISNPVRSLTQIDAITTPSAQESMPYIVEAIQLIRRELPSNIPLIGFAGAPFTLASYAIEGQGSRNYTHVKKLMYSHPDAWHQLMSKISDAVIDYVQVQIAAGVQAMQLFDSWVGALGVSEYQRFVLPHSSRVIKAIQGTVPIIHFGTGNPALLPDMATCGAEVMALDWRAPLKSTWDALGVRAVQGNLDPIALLAEERAVLGEAERLLLEVGQKPGHIFNLGHGIIPETPVAHVKSLVRFVQERSGEIRS
jgi:uroporphyrinogen decarboxylase